jgi:radical SAM superfamily enzyme YgiQ (UPF0313 family)
MEIKKKKILFCYFSPREVDYTPTDIGYVVAILKKAAFLEYDFEILQLNYEIGNDALDKELKREIIKRDVDLIQYYSPDAVFLFADNVLWSKVFALGRATLVAKEVRRKMGNIFLGIQSYKINNDQAIEVLDDKIFDCVINGNPEDIFLDITNILDQKYVEGVRYQKEVSFSKSDTLILSEKKCSIENLDNIPSPYLEHIFDNYIQERQIERKGKFRAFIISSRGCGFGCYYCFRSVKFEKVRYFSAQRFYDEMEYLYNNFGVCNYFVLDDAFLYSKQRLREFSQEFEQRVNKNKGLGKIQMFIMARPETIDQEVVEILAKLKVKFIQIGLQTVNPALQHYMRRTIDVVYFKKIQTWLQKYDIKLYLDIVVGLPGDSVEWLKETIRFAILLEPYSMQVKQFYMNPNTLFEVKRDEYEIEIDTMHKDFDVPYVVSSKGIDEEYFIKSNEFIMQRINENPKIWWKYISKKQRFLSAGFYN